MKTWPIVVNFNFQRYFFISWDPDLRFCELKSDLIFS
jgi:hypothetical protein